MNKNKLWYKNAIWWTHLLLFAIMLIFLIIALYFAVFKEHWYINEANIEDFPASERFIHFVNFDVLMSFFSVQVNIITTVWLLICLFNINKKVSYITSERFRLVIMNWNITVFIVFWIGVIIYIAEGHNLLNNYSIMQMLCTVLTHFVAFIILITLFIMTNGNQKYLYKNFWKEKEIYIVDIYLFLYTIYVWVRGTMYDRDGWIYFEQFPIPNWPYFFLNFNKPFIGHSKVGYFIFITLITWLWILPIHMFLIFINNFVYKYKIKKISKNDQDYENKQITQKVLKKGV